MKDQDRKINDNPEENKQIKDKADKKEYEIIGTRNKKKHKRRYSKESQQGQRR